MFFVPIDKLQSLQIGIIFSIIIFPPFFSEIIWPPTKFFCCISFLLQHIQYAVPYFFPIYLSHESSFIFLGIFFLPFISFLIIIPVSSSIIFFTHLYPISSWLYLNKPKYNPLCLHLFIIFVVIVEFSGKLVIGHFDNLLL